MNWNKILRYIGGAIILYFCGVILYLWLSFNGPVPQKLFYLILILVLMGGITADFHEDIIKWFKKHFGN